MSDLVRSAFVCFISTMPDDVVTLHVPIDHRQAREILLRPRELPSFDESELVSLLLSSSLARNQARIAARTTEHPPMYVVSFEISVSALEFFKPQDWEVNGIEDYWIYDEHRPELNPYILSDLRVSRV